MPHPIFLTDFQKKRQVGHPARLATLHGEFSQWMACQVSRSILEFHGQIVVLHKKLTFPMGFYLGFLQELFAKRVRGRG